MTDREAITRIIAQQGSCDGVICEECPLKWCGADDADVLSDALEWKTRNPSSLALAVREFLTLLDIEEESDNGSLFHPTHITSCRTTHVEKLSKLLPRMKELAEGNTP